MTGKSAASWLCCTFMLLAGTSQVYAGAWTMKKHTMYNRFVYNHFQSDEVYTTHGSTEDMSMDGRFYDHNINWYQEFGITNDLTFISSLYYKWLYSKDNYKYQNSYGPGDAEFGLKYNVYEGPVVVSMQALYKFGKLYGEETPPIGNRQDDLEIRLLTGKSLWPFPGYCGFEVGYRIREGRPADEMRFLAELGVDFNDYFYGRIKLDGIWGMGNADKQDLYSPEPPETHDSDVNSLLGAGITALDVDSSSSGNVSADTLSLPSENPTTTQEFNLLKADMAIGWHITPKLGCELGFTPTLWGENTAKGYTWSVGIVYVW